MAQVEAEENDWVPADTWGARLMLVRQHMRWNITAAATACGLSSESWRQWDRGTSPQRMEVAAQRIAATTGCSYSWLMAGGQLPRTGSWLNLIEGDGQCDQDEHARPALSIVR